MIRFRNIVYIALILPFLLSYTSVGSSDFHDFEQGIPVTYRAEMVYPDVGFQGKRTFPTDGDAITLDLNFDVDLDVAAEVTGHIYLYEGNRTVSLRGGDGHLRTAGSIKLTGDIVMDFTLPLLAAFFGGNTDVHIRLRKKIPESPAHTKSWQGIKHFDHSFLLSNSYPRSVTLHSHAEPVTVFVAPSEILSLIANVIWQTAITAPLKHNLSDYMVAGIQFQGHISNELNLRGKAVTVNGTPITQLGSIGASGLDPTQETYQIQSTYDEEFTHKIDMVANSQIYAKFTFLKGIEIWSYHNFEGTRIPILNRSVSDLDFSEVSISKQIDALPEPSDVGNAFIPDKFIPDNQLEQRLRQVLNVPWDREIMLGDMLRLTNFHAWSIRDLTGLESAVNLTTLDISGNAISDLSPLSNLTNLKNLYLQDNLISDLSPLSNLINLERLDLRENSVSEVSLSNLPNLTSLDLQGNPLSEVSLSNLPNLTSLDLQNFVLSEVSLSNLPNLTSLALGNTSVSKVALSNLPNVKSLYLVGNSISEVAVSDLPNLTELSLSRNRISDVSGLRNLPNLTELFFEENAISDVFPLSVFHNLKRLGLQRNKISEVSWLGSLQNLTELILEDNTISNVSGLDSCLNLTYLNIRRNAIFDALPLSKLPNLTWLELSGNAISEMPNFSGHRNLTYLSLGSNALSEASLSRLPNLTQLLIGNNCIVEVSLSDLPNLTSLGISGNPILKLSLSGLPNLTGLHPGISVIKDVTLSGLTNLRTLNLGYNPISKMSLVDLPSLTTLNLDNTKISDVTPLGSLTSLTTLNLGNSMISDVAALGSLTNLKILNLDNTGISDVGPLVGLTDLTELWLYNNLLNYASRNTHIPTMEARGVLVGFVYPVYPRLVKISGEDQVDSPKAGLRIPFVVQALDVEHKPVPNVSIKFVAYQGGGVLSTTTTRTDAIGKAQTVLTLGPDPGPNKVAVIAEGFEEAVSFTATATPDAPEPVRILEDVNADGVVNIQDLVVVCSNLGATGENAADVNGDGVVNIHDIVQVSDALQ